MFVHEFIVICLIWDYQFTIFYFDVFFDILVGFEFFVWFIVWLVILGNVVCKYCDANYFYF